MDRKGFIGGSDAVKIMQGDWLELWAIKTGRTEPEDLSKVLPVQMGIHTEPFNLRWFCENYDTHLMNHQEPYEALIGGVPIKGTIDAMTPDGMIVEAKHTHAMNTMDNIIEYYMPQIQLYMRLAESSGTYMSVIFGNSKWESAHVAYNEDYFNSMWAVVSDFWDYVSRDEEPIGYDVPRLVIDKIAVDQMVKRDANKDNAFVYAAHEYREHEQAARLFESAKRDLKNMVGQDEREVYCDLLTVRRDKRGALRITTRKDK